MNEPILSIENVSNVFDDGKQVLKNVSFCVNAGDFVCILGPSGCGKTTLLRSIGGFSPVTGEIKLDGQAVSGPGISRMMVFQSFEQLFHWNTVRENVMFPLIHNGTAKKEAKAIADEYLEKVNLSGYGDYYPHQLSGGMKQRVAIAKALAVKPRILLMDEPFASLDAVTRRKLQAVLLEMKEAEGDKLTVLFVTHSIQEALTLSTRLLVISAQGMIQLDEPNPLPKPVTPAVPGYGDLWAKYNQAIEFDCDK